MLLKVSEGKKLSSLDLFCCVQPIQVIKGIFYIWKWTLNYFTRVKEISYEIHPNKNKEQIPSKQEQVQKSYTLQNSLSFTKNGIMAYIHKRKNIYQLLKITDNISTIDGTV